MATTVSITNANVAMTITSQQIASVRPGTRTITLSANQYFGGILTIGTSEEAITFTDVTTPRVLTMVNLDTTNYVQWGPTSGGAMVTCGRMYPADSTSGIGVSATFEIDSGTTLRLKANTNPCQVQFFVSGS